MSTKLTFDAAVTAIGRLYDGEPIGPIAAANGLSDRALLADLRGFVDELVKVVKDARLTTKSIPIGPHGSLYGHQSEMGPGEQIISRGAR